MVQSVNVSNVWKYCWAKLKPVDFMIIFKDKKLTVFPCLVNGNQLRILFVKKFRKKAFQMNKKDS